MQRTYLALATLAAVATGAMTELTTPLRWANAAPSRAPLAQQQQRSLARPSTTSTTSATGPTQASDLTALPPATPPPLPEPVVTPAGNGQSPQIVALQVIPFTP